MKPAHCFLFSCLAVFLYPLTADAQTGIFSATGSMTVPRFQHTMTLLANGQVLATGGFSGPGFSPLWRARNFMT